MKRRIDPGRKEAPISILDNIVYSHVTDLEGNPMDLKMSITADLGNSEMMALRGMKLPDDVPARKRPAVIWFNGSGWKACEKNMQLADLVYLAQRGYALVCAEYRSSDKGHFPAQYTDAKTAVRFIRTNASKYGIDPDRIAVMGRSAGGQMAAMLGRNDGQYISQEYASVSSDVQAVVDMFGPVDVLLMAKEHYMQSENGTLFELTHGRWKTIWDTPEGGLIGGDLSDFFDKAGELSANRRVTEHNAPTLILHGDADPAVPISISEAYYDALCEKGVKADMVTLAGAGHGTPEFFQKETKQVILDWLGENL